MVTWSSYNYPTGINSTGESVVFNYGPNRQRWKTVYTGSIGTETTYHIGSLLEKVANAGTIDYRHYIKAGNEQVAIYSRTSAGTNTLRYVLEDHLSSFAGIVSDSTPGPVAVDVNESFTAFGNRRSGSTWSGAPSSQDESTINGISRDGYTGETVLGVSMGLNHLNGRVEDAITGRFLSPDPNTPNPGNTQSWNRYSYVNNNPLTLMDPTGFFACKDSCNFPSGAYHWNSSLLQSVFGGEATSVSRTGIAGNTGDGGLGGIWASNFTGAAGSDATDTAPLDDSGGIQIQPGASSADGTNTSDSSEPGNAASPNPTGASGSAQSGQPIDMSPSSDGLDPVLVEGHVSSTTPGIYYSPQQPGSFPCGSVTCTWSMGAYVDARYSIPLRGVTLQVKGPGIPNGSKWVQTYIATSWEDDDTGQPVQDCDTTCPFFTGGGTNSQYFFDPPGRYGSSGSWFANATLIGPNGASIVTFSWGFSLSPGGMGGITPIWPQVVPR